VRALLPTAGAAALLTQEFTAADVVMDGTLFTVCIYGVAYGDAVARIKEWMHVTQIGPVLVTDDAAGELLLTDFAARSRRAELPDDTSP
jgi:hypothetical protein